LTLCGLGACVDALLSAHDAIPVLLDSADRAARTLGETLARRAEAGIEGEIRVYWDDGPHWPDSALRQTTAPGGTDPHATRILPLLGAPALLALEHRDAEQMACLDGGICLAHNGHPVAACDITPRGLPRPKVYIFEFTAGRRVCEAIAPRSSRIIVRFTDPDIEDDSEFEAPSITLGDQVGAAVPSGFNAAGEGAFDGDLQADEVVSTTERIGVDRLCIHADTWALSATRGERDRERSALMMGRLLAGTRAALGRSARPIGLGPDAVFEVPPAELHGGGFSVVACAAPYLPRPATDTFMAGCLLVLGQSDHPNDPPGHHMVMSETSSRHHRKED
jgi:hypothetical protein